MKTKKIDLYYSILKNKSVDVLIEEGKEKGNFNYCNYKNLIKDFPKKDFNYIKIN